jgi:Gpi18-like mannosyltransferase
MPGRSRASIVLRWFVASRLVIAALGVIGVATFANVKFADGVRDAQHASAVVDNVTALNPQTVWHKWDAPFYERIADQGYAFGPDDVKGQATAGYFPLYPVTVGAVMRVIPSLDFFWTATMLSNLFTVAALLLLVTQLVSGVDLAGRVLAIMMTSAGSFYLSIPYAESLFLLLVVATLVATRRRHYELAGLLAGLSGTARVHGFALVAVPALACWLDTQLPGRTRALRTAASITLFALPLIGYFAYLGHVQGSWLAFLTRQQMWDNPSPYPFQAIVGLLEFPRRIASWVHGATWLVYVGLLIRYRRRLPPGELLFCAGALLISTQQAGFQGIYRYVVPLVPLTLALAGDRDDVRHRMIAFNLVLGVLMILAFVTENRLAV